MSLTAEPFRTFSTPEGTPLPLYIVRFDRNGVCTSPQARSQLLEAVKQGGFTDIFLFSHGWNNDFPTALASYEGFIQGYSEMRRSRGLTAPPGYRPLAIGIYWPSAILLFGSEAGPQIAASLPASSAEMSEIELQDEIARQLPEQNLERFYALSQSDKLNSLEAEVLASLLLLIPPGSSDEIGDDQIPNSKDLVEVWKRFQEPSLSDSDGDHFGTVEPAGTPAVTAGPQTAGWLDWIDPRAAIRLTTVWMMKDRAGTVGANGVGPLLRDLLQNGSAKVHLIGHSYGCKVLLSATCIARLPRPVRSMLLLQPAVSHLCFASQLPGLAQPGGYRGALQAVEQPILATYSQHDYPLTSVFHYAVRRNRDLGDIQIAACAGAPPSRFAALGGYGPRSSGETLIDMAAPGDRYALNSQTRVYGLDSSKFIKGHSDISNEATWWAFSQLAHSSE
ncbi:alpha/beta fold hydrolase [Planctomicrobium piriforme]|uniref:Alpha/beta hydrolase n=1 Tax=Planctomicrobium piriforme TaxID=1576369 RepID=A0A1I3JD14_9PLAN|nr:hypothetical protein [Planctomicrobium piriforme]SFI58133.1 hypothetical protein SAMN05421753_110135 [Planctomicrobium piriforme]